MGKMSVANRPSQPNDEYVLNARGEKVRNIAYKGKKGKGKKGSKAAGSSSVLDSIQAGTHDRDNDITPTRSNDPEYQAAVYEDNQPDADNAIRKSVARSAVASVAEREGFSSSEVSDGLVKMEKDGMQILVDSSTPTESGQINMTAMGKNGVPLTVQTHENTISGDLDSVVKSMNETGNSIDMDLSQDEILDHNISFTQSLNYDDRLGSPIMHAEFGGHEIRGVMGKPGEVKNVEVSTNGEFDPSIHRNPSSGAFEVQTTGYSTRNLEDVDKIADGLKDGVKTARELDTFFSSKMPETPDKKFERFMEQISPN